MRSFFLLAIVVAALAIAGCTMHDHVYTQGRCLTCINNPVTGEPVNYDPEDEQPMPSEHASKAASAPVVPTTFVLNVPIDVDTAYAGLRSAFGFRSDADFNNDLRSDRLMQMDEAYHYEATPGAFYPYVFLCGVSDDDYHALIRFGAQVAWLADFLAVS